MSDDENKDRAEKKRSKTPALSPRCWQGMTAGVWFRFFFGSGCAPSPSRLGLTATVTASSIFNSVMRPISEAVYSRRANAVQFDEPPVFVIGHWRTGTTWMHELLVRDERFAYPTTYQCNGPHHFLLTAKVIAPILNLFLPKKRPMDDMPVSMDRPQEDEFALANLGVGSPYLDWGFPFSKKTHLQYLTLQELDEQQRQRWVDGFLWFLRRVTLKNPRRLILKSPTHTARISTLLKIFPDARFIHLVRNPMAVIPSTQRMWTDLTDALTLQVTKGLVPIELIFTLFETMYDQFEQERSLIPAGNLLELRYEDLVAEPLSNVEQIYQQLRLGDFEPARPVIDEYLQSLAGYKANRNEISADLKQQIYQQCRAYIEQYGYEDDFSDLAAETEQPASANPIV